MIAEERATGELTLQSGTISLRIDPATSAVRQFTAAGIDWLPDGAPLRFAAPFVNGTQASEVYLSLAAEAISPAHVRSKSVSGRTTLDLRADGEVLSIGLTHPPRIGPRAGLELDLDLLDLATGTDVAEQVMPHVLYTADDCSYAYFLWHRRNDQFLLMVVDEPFAAWRIKYSFNGHRMTGFQVLSIADDVIMPPGRELRSVESLSVKVTVVGSVDEALAKAAELLEIGIAKSRLSGGIVGSHITVDRIGSPSGYVHGRPDGSETPLREDGRITLDAPGIHQIISRSGNRTHVSRVLAHESWETIYDRVNTFYRDHGQHECGAFFTAVHCDTLKPDGKTYEGQSFGDPTRPNSCRAGEFGGFGGWAMIKNMLIFGQKPAFRPAVDRYILNWALNRGHEAAPSVNTICKHPFEQWGINWSAYHLFRDTNFMQAECFFLKELVDYVRLTGDASVLHDAIGLARHMIADHQDSDGKFTCQNRATQPRKDYTTVDAPGVALVQLWRLLHELGRPEATEFAVAAERVADYLVSRGTACPTEGEPCTEDGSMACTAWTLLHTYVFLKPKPSYLKSGLAVLDLRKKLELHGTDCRMNNSSLRFWETQYETDSWGPSINAGHGWTIWTAMAKVCAYLATDDIRHLREAYASFISCLSKIDKNGGMFCCYTPDMIPGTPHPWYYHHQPPEIAGDTTQTSTVLGSGYPNTYAASGNHAIVMIAESWATMSGLCADGTTINGKIEDGRLVSAAPKFDRLALESAPSQPLKIAVEPGLTLTITTTSGDAIRVQGAEVLEQPSARRLVCRAAGSDIVITRDIIARRT
jgi:hypothetical protein